MSKTTGLRYRSVVITIQNLDIFAEIQWARIPKLVRVTCQLEDKNPDGLPTERTHMQAFLEFSDKVAQSTLRKHLPHVHLPDAEELEALRVRYPQGLKPSLGRFYCSNPVKRVENTDVMIWEHGRWTSGSDFIAWLKDQSLVVEKVFEMPKEIIKPSFFIRHNGSIEEVIEWGGEKLRPLVVSQNDRAELGYDTPEDAIARLRSLEKLRKNNYKP